MTFFVTKRRELINICFINPVLAIILTNILHSCHKMYCIFVEPNHDLVARQLWQR
jgi:hypothetical protein